MPKSCDHLYSSVNIALCLTASVHLILTICYDLNTIRIAPNFQWAGKIVYLTFWNLCIEAMYFAFAALESVLPRYLSAKSSALLRKIRNYWFISIVFPLSLLVTAAFWGLWTIDRGLLVRTKSVKIPMWLNHTIHTLVCLYSVLELITAHHNTSASVNKLLVSSWLLIALYAVWSICIWLRSDMWTYPFLEYLSWPSRAAFFIITELTYSAFLLFGYHVNNFWWKKDTGKNEKNLKKS